MANNILAVLLFVIALLSVQAVSAQTATTFTGKTWSTFPGGAKAVCADSDIDNDNDGLIELCYLEGLDAMRYALDGSGYKASASATTNTQGCARGGCKGYEMVRDLDFRDNDSYRNSTANMTKWTTGTGWLPIGKSLANSFRSIFEGNGHTLSNLRIIRPDEPSVGLFGLVRRGTDTDNFPTNVNGIGLVNIDIQGLHHVGGLAGYNLGGTINNSYSTGRVTGESPEGVITGGAGGLVGTNSASITNTYSTCQVRGHQVVGGLVGWNTVGTIYNSYSTGPVAADTHAGGLIGVTENSKDSSANNYSLSRVTGDRTVGGLIGESFTPSRPPLFSYWDITASRVASSVGGTSQTTVELQTPTASTGIYSEWSEKDWGFGTTIQYPALKYATDANADYQTCGTSQQPVCGSLLAGQRIRHIVVSPQTSVRAKAVESETVTLDATRSGTNLTYVWEQTDGRDVSYLSTTDSAMLRFLVPLNVASGGATATGVLMFHLTVNDDSAATVSIVVYDDSDDGSITTPTITRLPAGRMAVSVNLASDPDGAGKIEAYQWQICSTTCSQWQNASGASTNSSYQIPTAEVAENNQFRVQLTYRDGQNFQRTLLSTSLFYINQKPMITDIDPITTTEGEVVTLVAKASDADFDNLNYIWRVTTGDKTTSILVASTVTNAILVFTVPKVWTNTTQATLSLSISVSDGATTSTKPVVVNIARADNGGLTTTTPTITEVEQKLTVSPISAAALATDPDGAGTIEAYQWQICLAGEDCKQESQWKDISSATNNTYQIPQAEAIANNRFRVQITYRDGQGYRRTVTSEVFSYPQKAMFMRLKLFLEGALQ